MEYILDKPVVASIGTEKYKCTVEWRNGKFISDEPEAVGGKDTGPDPFTLFLSSLGTCTLATLRMYIDRKEWDIPQIAIAVNMYFKIENEKKITVIDRDINFLSPITDVQRERLIQIAKVCPVSKIMEGEIQVRAFAIQAHN
jgi:putative redox protein